MDVRTPFPWGGLRTHRRFVRSSNMCATQITVQLPTRIHGRHGVWWWCCVEIRCGWRRCGYSDDMVWMLTTFDVVDNDGAVVYEARKNNTDILEHFWDSRYFKVRCSKHSCDICIVRVGEYHGHLSPHHCYGSSGPCDCNRAVLLRGTYSNVARRVR
jgi:hypothetical protein